MDKTVFFLIKRVTEKETRGVAPRKEAVRLAYHETTGPPGPG